MGKYDKTHGSPVFVFPSNAAIAFDEILSGRALKVMAQEGHSCTTAIHGSDYIRLATYELSLVIDTGKMSPKPVTSNRVPVGSGRWCGCLRNPVGGNLNWTGQSAARFEDR